MNAKLALLGLAGTLSLAACGGSSGGGGGGGADEHSFVSCASGVCTLSGTIDESYTLDSSMDWILDGVVTVGNGNQMLNSTGDISNLLNVVLTIPAGTEVKALSDGVLLVTRGSRIIANGTAANPITFSSLDAGFNGLGEWGGIVVQGFAPQYGPGNTGACFGTGTICNVAGEGGADVAFYGGNDPADDSGVFRYVRIAEGGLVAGPNNEVNGLTLQGVGHGTEIEFVQVHGNLDDGVEWFGGTVNARYLVLTSNDDDSIDFDEGYKGNIQYAIVQMDSSATAPQGSNDPRGIEANSSDDEWVPQTDAVLANITIKGAAINDGEPGMRLRGALTVAVYNTAVEGFDSGCVRIDDADTDGDSVNDQISNVTLVNVLGECAAGFYTGNSDHPASPDTNSGAATVNLDAAYAMTDGAAQLPSATAIGAVDNGSGFAFDATDYVGAVEPGTSAANAWWAGWTLPGTVTP